MSTQEGEFKTPLLDQPHQLPEIKANGSGNAHAPSIPTDKNNIIYIIVVLLGMGSLLPFSSFISAPDYFFKLYGSFVLNAIAISNSLTFLLVTALMVLFIIRVIPLTRM